MPPNTGREQRPEVTTNPGTAIGSVQGFYYNQPVGTPGIIIERLNRTGAVVRFVDDIAGGFFIQAVGEIKHFHVHPSAMSEIMSRALPRPEYSPVTCNSRLEIFGVPVIAVSDIRDDKFQFTTDIAVVEGELSILMNSINNQIPGIQKVVSKEDADITAWEERWHKRA